MTVAATLDLSKYVELFLSEGREHVAELNAALAALEHDAASVDSIAAAFRAVHSVKGMSAAMGYSHVSEIAHALESALDPLRAGAATMTRELHITLLERADALGSAIEDAVRPANSAQREGAPSRAPRASHVRVRATRLDSLMNLVGELEIARGALDRDVRRVGDAALAETYSSLTRLLAELRAQVMSARMVPVGEAFDRFPRLVRETARDLGRDVDFTLDGGDIEVDRSLVDRIADPVMHLLRNSLDHGIEPPDARVASGKPRSGRLTLSAQRESEFVLIRVADDGRGIDRAAVLTRAKAAGIAALDLSELNDTELLRILVHPGFSTAASVTSVSGRGVGLDVVDTTVRALGGAIEMKSVAGRGTAINLRLPLSIAIVRALIARIGESSYAIPFTHVLETLELDTTASASSSEPARAALDGARLVRMRARLGVTERQPERTKGVSVTVRGQRAVLVVDELVGEQDVVVKRFDPPRGGTRLFSGATVLGDGSTALILDVSSLF